MDGHLTLCQTQYPPPGGDAGAQLFGMNHSARYSFLHIKCGLRVDGETLTFPIATIFPAPRPTVTHRAGSESDVL